MQSGARMERGIVSDGFRVLPGVFPAAEMDRLAERLSQSAVPRTRAGIRHLLADEAVESLANDSRLVDLARHLLGPQAFPFHATLFDKSSSANWLVTWHQDTALPLRERRDAQGWGPWSVKRSVTYAHAPASALDQVLAIRVHLDESDNNNGPLRVLPCTHLLGVLTDDEIHQLSLDVQPIECGCEVGGVVMMRPLTVHASSKVTSDRRRRVLQIEYAAQRLFDQLELAVA